MTAPDQRRHRDSSTRPSVHLRSRQSTRGRLQHNFPSSQEHSPPHQIAPPYGWPQNQLPQHIRHAHSEKLLQSHDAARSGADMESSDVTHLRPSPQATEHVPNPIEEDPADLLGRLHLAIPDLEQLLKRYRETHGELGVRDALVKKKEAESAVIIKHKEEYIHSLTAQIAEAETRHSQEVSALRLHIGSMEKSMKDLQAQLRVSEAQNTQVEASLREAQEQRKALIRERMLISKAVAEDRDRLITETETAHSALQKQLDTEHTRVLELTSQTTDLDARATAAESTHASLSQTIATLTTQLAAADTTISTLRDTQHAALAAGLEQENAALLASHAVEMEALKRAHREELHDATQGFLHIQEVLNGQMTRENVALKELLDEVRRAGGEERRRLEVEIASLKVAAPAAAAAAAAASEER